MATIHWTNALDDTRSKKLQELKEACNITILGRFSHVFGEDTYYFSNDMEAQANFEKCDRAFEKGRLTEIPWTAYDSEENVVRLIFDSASFEPLYISHLTHIQSNIVKFRDILMPRVVAAQTVPELVAINWDDPLPPQTPVEETPTESPTDHSASASSSTTSTLTVIEPIIETQPA